MSALADVTYAKVRAVMNTRTSSQQRRRRPHAEQRRGL